MAASPTGTGKAAPRVGATIPTRSTLALLVLTTLLPLTPTASGDPVPVRFSEGTVHGFLIVRDEADSVLARGDLLQAPRDSVIKSQLILRFRDKSFFDETISFTQHRFFELKSYRLVQRGPAFGADLDASIEAGGEYHVSAVSHQDGKLSTWQGTLALPSDVANGLPVILAKNLRRGDTAHVHLVAFTPKPRLVGLELAWMASDSLHHGGHPEEVLRFRVKPELGGLTGILAKLLGKVPPDSFIWVVSDQTPTFLRFQGPLYDGPVWQLGVTTPAFPEPPGHD